MRILHTEASTGWGGQEMRILKEAIGMQKRGHHVILAVQVGGTLIDKARKEGFLVYPIHFSKKKALWTFFSLFKIILKHKIEWINTHSSLDAWIGGILGKLLSRKVIRTRHLSTPIRKGLNSYLLYNVLADKVITTSFSTEEMIRKQAKLREDRIQTIATGIDPEKLVVDSREVSLFRTKYGIQENDCLIGTLCVLRSWKGISDFLKAAKRLEEYSHLKWIVVGGGSGFAHFVNERDRLGLEKRVIFTGHMDEPSIALTAMDLFVLLSTAHEGISQSSLQAAYLKKPLITTKVGGLIEVCLHEITGFQVPISDPESVALAILKLQDASLRQSFGERAQRIVKEKFTSEMMLDKIENFLYHL